MARRARPELVSHTDRNKEHPAMMAIEKAGPVRRPPRLAAAVSKHFLADETYDARFFNQK